MKVLFFTRYNGQGASSRCRVYQYLPRLAACDIESEVVPWAPAAGEIEQRAGAVDAVFLQKRVPTLGNLLRLRRRAAYLLFDFDDALWLRRRRDNTVCKASPRTRLRLAATLRLVDQVIAGNEYLASYTRRWNRRVAVLPTPIDGEYYSSDLVATPGNSCAPANNTLSSSNLCLGWVGHPSNLPYLRRLEPVLATLARRFPALKLRVVCSEPFECAAIPVENIPWSLADEVANLRRLDIGLMPLDYDSWTRGKCGYKALQYMAVGVPVVCSPVGMNVEIVQQGQTGLLAADLDDWERQLTLLVNAPDLRQRLGAGGQRAVLRDYSLARMAPRLADILRAGARTARRGAPEATLLPCERPSRCPPPPGPAEPSHGPTTSGTAHRSGRY
jgi:glycosyltransferase involved in cell wall biosynthesis